MASSLTLVFPSSPRQSSTASKLTVDYSSLGDVQEWCNALGPDGSVVGSFRGTGLLAFAIASSVSWLEDKGVPTVTFHLAFMTRGRLSQFTSGLRSTEFEYTRLL
ncbi:uncharacterized protein ARMOST_19992 [Armillaria ostoyae]|uniref:Thioesterase domain-containing protein n=1 Tax=Armillaria ostoyae TaxID=47428 RepID=A0A284S678_ARMOS|nr:uncharacterized protein ARMOST_19992 [Armillaria ostoyae]